MNNQCVKWDHEGNVSLTAVQSHYESCKYLERESVMFILTTGLFDEKDCCNDIVEHWCTGDFFLVSHVFIIHQCLDNCALLLVSFYHL